jgi:scyllo-inosamine-4-phosphate amidinotransferase 1
MIISSNNEWDKLQSIVVGSATYANWPNNDPVFAQEESKTLWKETPVPSGPVPQWIVDETNEDLEYLVKVLQALDITVHRPNEMNFVETNGMYNYCPRDRLLIAGDSVVDPAMMYPCRDQEIDALSVVIESANKVITMPRGLDMVLDAANICRLNDTWLYLLSSSGNQLAADWLQQQLPNITIETCNFYSGVHIDSTIVPLRDGFVLLNASRVNSTTCPKVFDGWTKIYVNDMVAQGFHQYPYASKWIGLNMLSIDPHTVIVDKNQIELIAQLEKEKFTVIPLELRHSRTLGGGFHCVTLDLHRVG